MSKPQPPADPPRHFKLFVAEVADSYPTGLGCLSGALVFAFFIALLLSWREAQTWLFAPLLLILGFAAGGMCHSLIERIRTGYWCRDVLLPRARSSCVSPDELLDYLERLDAKDKRHPESVRRLAENAAIIGERLAALGALSADAPGGGDGQADGAPRVERFVGNIARTLSSNTGCAPAVVVFLAVASALLWWPVTRCWIWGPLLLVGGLVAGLLVFVIWSRYRFAQWVEDMLVAQAKSERIPLADVLDFLERVDQQYTHAPKRVDYLVQERDSVARRLAALGAIGAAAGRNDTTAKQHAADDAASPVDRELIDRLAQDYIPRSRREHVDGRTQFERLAPKLKLLAKDESQAAVFDEVLVNWPDLPQSERSALVEGAHEQVDAELLRQQLSIIEELCRETAPRALGCWLWLAGAALSVVLPFCFAATRHWLWTPLLMVAGVFTCTLLVAAIYAARYRFWHAHLGRPARDRGADFDILADLLPCTFPTQADDGRLPSEQRRHNQIAQFAWLYLRRQDVGKDVPPRLDHRGRKRS